MKNLPTHAILILMLIASGTRAQQVNQNFNYLANAFHTYTIPTTGWYLIECNGAAGGASSNLSHSGGLGARMRCYVQLQSGVTLRIAVGESGGLGSNAGNNVSGGGGGSSSIFKVNGRPAVVVVGAVAYRAVLPNPVPSATTMAAAVMEAAIVVAAVVPTKAMAEAMVEIWRALRGI